MLKSMVTELLRDTLGRLPQRVPSDCGATGGKASSGAKTEEGNGRETPKVAGGGAGRKDLDSGAGETGISVLAKRIQEEGGRIP